MTLAVSQMRRYFIACLLALTATISWGACGPSSTPFATSTPATNYAVMSTATPTLAPIYAATSTATPKPLPMPTMAASPRPTRRQTKSKETVKGGIRGQGLAISKSDVMTMPDSVLTAGEVLFIPEEHAEDLAETVDFDPSKMSYMGHALFQLNEFRLSKLAGAAAVIGADGRFPLDIPAGRYFVCLADIFSGHTAGPPYTVVGCAVIDLPNDASLTVSWGEGGVQAGLGEPTLMLGAPTPTPVQVLCDLTPGNSSTGE